MACLNLVFERIVKSEEFEKGGTAPEEGWAGMNSGYYGVNQPVNAFKQVLLIQPQLYEPQKPSSFRVILLQSTRPHCNVMKKCLFLSITYGKPFPFQCVWNMCESKMWGEHHVGNPDAPGSCCEWWFVCGRNPALNQPDGEF
jgi:hypothetical protein